MIRKSSLILSLLCFASPLSTHAQVFGNMTDEEIAGLQVKKGEHYRGGYKRTPDHTKEFFHRLNAKRMALRDPSKARAAKVLPPSVDFRPYCASSLLIRDNSASSQEMHWQELYTYDKLWNHQIQQLLKQKLNLYHDSLSITQKREKEGTIPTDSGASIGDGIQSLMTTGAPPETDWPYDVTQFATKPSAQAYADAYENKDLGKIQASQIDIKNNPIGKMKALLNKKIPAFPVLGIPVYESFESQSTATTGIVPVPDVSTEKLLGGHAVFVVGYDETDENNPFLLVTNSWGADWGIKGFCRSRLITIQLMVWKLGKVTQAILTQPQPQPQPLLQPLLLLQTHLLLLHLFLLLLLRPLLHLLLLQTLLLLLVEILFCQSRLRR